MAFHRFASGCSSHPQASDTALLSGLFNCPLELLLSISNLFTKNCIKCIGFSLCLLLSQNKLISDFEPGLTFYSVIRKHFGRYEVENGVFVTDMSITVAQPIAKLLTISHFLQPLRAAQFPLCSPPGGVTLHGI
jgi:hypothetical protein